MFVLCFSSAEKEDFHRWHNSSLFPLVVVVVVVLVVDLLISLLLLLFSRVLLPVKRKHESL